MQNFFETIRTHLKTRDVILFEELLYNLSKLPTVPVEVTNDLMEICRDHEEIRVSVLTKGANFEKDDKTITLLLQWITDLPFQHKILVKNFLNNTKAELLVKHAEDLLYYVGAEYIKYESQFLPFEGKRGEELAPVWAYYMDLIQKMAVAFDVNLYETAKLAQDTLLRADEYHASEIAKLLSHQLQNNILDENGILAIRAIGRMELQPFAGVLVELLTYDEEELLLAEVIEACIRLQSEEIVDALAHVQPTDALFKQAVIVLKGIKSVRSSEVLAAMYPLATDTGMRETILDALTSHFSPLAIPLIDDFIEKGEYAMVYDMNEMFYAYYRVLNREHPLLEQWHTVACKNAQQFEESFKEVDLQAVVRENFGKIGRNDPCICGSGKKFKKCCGKEA